ncbi:MAG: crotonase/enoyl-CoA hydratase family protein [Solirubrobacteraceae bacterium]
MSATKPAVLWEARDGVQVITINRPAVRNALNGEVARGVAAAIDELEGRDDLRVGILTGAGGTFSSGMDFKAFLEGDLPLIDGRGVCGLTEAPPLKPLIAAVEGWAVAGGFELVLACDLVVAAETSMFGLPEVKRGLVAGAGGALLLTRRIPQAVALEMLLTGNPITAQRAAALGLVNQVTPEAGALTGALELATIIAANGPLAVSVSKAIARSSAGWPLDSAWDQQARLLQPVYESVDAHEGARAFVEGRPPRWTGR